MSSEEVTVPDVDIEVDALMMDEAARVDWHKLTEAEAAGFGLAMGLYRDVSHSHQYRRMAWGTATGGVISMSVLVGACLLFGSGPWFALSVVIGTQALRALWLYWKAHQARQDVRFMEQQALQVIRELAAAHPSKGTDTYQGGPSPQAG